MKLILIAFLLFPSRAFADNGAACPDQTTLRSLLATAWKIGTDRIGESPNDKIICVPGRFPTPGWVVATPIAAPDWGYFHRLGVVTADGTPVAIQDGETGKDRLLALNSIIALATNDFDGDGVDEIVETISSAYRGSPITRSVAVDTLRGTAFKPLLIRGFAYITAGDTGDLVCDGSFEITPQRALVIHGKLVHPQPPLNKDEKPECVNGTETYVDHGGVLVKK